MDLFQCLYSRLCWHPLPLTRGSLGTAVNQVQASLLQRGGTWEEELLLLNPSQTHQIQEIYQLTAQTRKGELRQQASLPQNRASQQLNQSLPNMSFMCFDTEKKKKTNITLIIAC